MNSGNAFWREVIDYLPHLILVFRVDEQDQAHLIFCNREITTRLGYSAKEYVLASETEGSVQEELGALVDEVARRSHDVDAIKPRPCTLTTKSGDQRDFVIDFRVFKTKSAGTPLILVELQPYEGRADSPEASASEIPQAYTQPKEDKMPFVAESNVMKAVLQKAELALAQQGQHLLLRGEKGTGRSTLARHLAEEEAGSAGMPVAEPGSEEFPAGRVVLALNIDEMDSSLQQQLLERLKENTVERIIATASRPVEDLVEDGRFNAELFYLLSFHAVMVPPLRHRREDIRALAQAYLKMAAGALDIQQPELSAADVDRLEAREWQGNIPQLFETIRYSLLKAGGGDFRVRIPGAESSEFFPEQKVDPDEVLAFDEMNRRYLERILELTAGKIYGDDGAAALLDLKPTTLQSKLKRLGIK